MKHEPLTNKSVFAFTGDPDDAFSFAAFLADLSKNSTSKTSLIDEINKTPEWENVSRLISIFLETAESPILISEFDAITKSINMGDNIDNTVFWAERNDLSNIIERAKRYNKNIDLRISNALYNEQWKSKEIDFQYPDDSPGDGESVLNYILSAGHVKFFSPSLRRLLNWNLSRGQIQEIQLKNIGRGPNPDLHISQYFIETLPPSLKLAAEHFAIFRRGIPQNEIFTFLEKYIKSDASSKLQQNLIAASTKAQELIESGLLVKIQDKYIIPRPLRQQLVAISRIKNENTYKELNNLIVHHFSKKDPTFSTSQESLYHQVESGSFDPSIFTMAPFKHVLRLLAYDLSLKEEFEKSANMYKYIVEHISATDPYAWEYLGYNLDKIDDPDSNTIVSKAFDKACELEPSNPLYQGRRIGHRVKLGEEILSDFEESWAFCTRTWQDRCTTWITEPILNMILFHKAHEANSKFLEKYSQAFKEHNRLRSILVKIEALS